MIRLAVLGGVYANPHALAAALADARARGADRVVCLGDLGGFGPDPDSVWPLLREGGVECIAGNYDIAIASGAEDCGCGYSDERDNHYAQVMYDLTRARTSAGFAAWMGELPGQWRERVGGLDVHMVHGSPLAVNDFMWESLSDDELRGRLAASGADVLLCTHTGIPWRRRVGGTLVVNVGAVGRPANDGRTGVWYALLEVEDGRARAELVPVDYDWRAQAQAIRESPLPDAFAVTIETGWWTTCLEVVPPPERARGRYHCYRDAIPPAPGWAPVPDAAPGAADDLPVVSLFGTPAFPSRLWVYTNFHCNLACDYCAVASAPTARRRSLGAARACALVDEAVAEGFTELYLTGGEPLLEPAIAEIAAHAATRLPTVLLTNAMLFGGRRRALLERLAAIPGLVLQTSLDGVRPATHDRHRGAGSFARAWEGVAAAAGLGMRVLVASTATRENADEMDELRDRLATIGVDPRDHAVRPLVARGFAQEGMEVAEALLVPELTVTADGVHWHPVGADAETSPDLMLASGAVPLAEGKRLVIERTLELRLADGTLPRPYACAIA